MTMKVMLVIVPAVLLAACAVPQGGMKMEKGSVVSLFGVQDDTRTGPFVDQIVQVVTIPPGAGVVVNGGMMGHAPLKVSVRRYWRGAAGSMVLDTTSVDALPAPGQCAQGGVYGNNNRRLPSRIVFNMTDCANPARPAPAAGKK